MSDASPVIEPLDETAALARRIAPQLCHVDPVTGNRCDWYHGPWQDFRRLGLVTSARTNGAFFVEVLRERARAGARRVLVSGCADQSMLAHVLHAWRAERREAEIEIVDLCETPLALCRWYAERASTKVVTHRSDVLELAVNEPFDLVCTHSFLTRFEPSRRPLLLSKWRALLRPGGYAVTAQRVRPSRAERLVRHSPEEASVFAERAHALARAQLERLDVTPEAIEAAALRYARLRAREPVRSQEELRALFEAGGFGLRRFDTAGDEEVRRDALAGPPDPASRRVRIVAQREDGA
jgi:SAM-dependent methyltransferase